MKKEPMTQEKAIKILSNLPAAFQEIQNRKLIDQTNGSLPVTQIRVARHYNVNNDIIEAMKRVYGKQGKRYSNICGCFGVHLHAELWLASAKSVDGAAPDGVYDASSALMDWCFIKGQNVLHRILLEFPRYKEWCDTRPWGDLTSFLEKECGAPRDPFGSSEWYETTPFRVLTNLNDWLGVETAR